MKKQNTIELFCGTKSFSKVAKERGYNTFTIDIDKQFNPDLCKNILDVDISELPKDVFILWASPPCQTFSMAAIYRYWDNQGKPKSYKTYIGLAMVKKTLEIIQELKPEYWFIENPRAMLRKQHFMQNLKRNSVTYCQYGDKVQKPTDIWNNCIKWISKKRCSAGDSCHETAKRGSDRGTQNQNRSPIKRAIVPPELIKEIFDAIENKSKIKQKKLFAP